MTDKFKTTSEYFKMPLWKWSLLLVAGLLLTFVAYGLVGGMGSFGGGVTVNICFSLVEGAGMLGFYACWSRLTEKQWPSDLSLAKASKNIVTGIGIGVAYFCVVTGILAALGHYKVMSVNHCCMDLLVSFFSCLVVACGEEVIFRGVLFHMIDKRFNTWAALSVSGLLFGLVHLLNPGATLWSAVAIAVEAGFLLGAAYKCSGALWLPIGIHWAWNFTEGNIFGFNVSGGSDGIRLFVPEISGPDLLTGGNFGPEASIVAVLLGLVLTVAFLRHFRFHSVRAI